MVDTISNLKQHKIADVNNPQLHGSPNVDNINFEVVLPNVQDYDSFKRELQHDSSFENMIQDMTINRLFNGSKLKKYKYG